jgi:hypothetical protein
MRTSLCKIQIRIMIWLRKIWFAKEIRQINEIQSLFSIYRSWNHMDRHTECHSVGNLFSHAIERTQSGLYRSFLTWPSRDTKYNSIFVNFLCFLSFQEQATQTGTLFLFSFPMTFYSEVLFSHHDGRCDFDMKKRAINEKKLLWI